MYYDIELKLNRAEIQELKIETTKCSKCKEYEEKNTFCRKYKMISEPYQTCKAYDYRGE